MVHATLINKRVEEKETGRRRGSGIWRRNNKDGKKALLSVVGINTVLYKQTWWLEAYIYMYMYTYTKLDLPIVRFVHTAGLFRVDAPTTTDHFRDLWKYTAVQVFFPCRKIEIRRVVKFLRRLYSLKWDYCEFLKSKARLNILPMFRVCHVIPPCLTLGTKICLMVLLVLAWSKVDPSQIER